jgi:hypothetical protein
MVVIKVRTIEKGHAVTAVASSMYLNTQIRLPLAIQSRLPHYLMAKLAMAD